MKLPAKRLREDKRPLNRIVLCVTVLGNGKARIFYADYHNETIDVEPFRREYKKITEGGINT